MSDTTTIAVRVPSELADVLRCAAKSQRRTVSNLVRNILEDALRPEVVEPGQGAYGTRDGAVVFKNWGHPIRDNQ